MTSYLLIPTTTGSGKDLSITEVNVYIDLGASLCLLALSEANSHAHSSTTTAQA